MSKAAEQPNQHTALMVAAVEVILARSNTLLATGARQSNY
jgi:hypothetical protein